MKHPRASSGPGAEVRKPCSISMNTKRNKRRKYGVQTPAYPGKGPCLGEAPRRLAAERRRLGECCSWILLRLLATEAVLPCGGDQVLQRPHNTPTHTVLVWPSLMGQASGALPDSSWPRQRPWLQDMLEEGAGVPEPSGSGELSWVPKALRHASDHKHGGGGGQSLFLESSKAGDFSVLVQPLAPVPPAPSRATVSCTQAPPTDSEAQPPTPS